MMLLLQAHQASSIEQAEDKLPVCVRVTVGVWVWCAYPPCRLAPTLCCTVSVCILFAAPTYMWPCGFDLAPSNLRAACIRLLLKAMCVVLRLRVCAWPGWSLCVAGQVCVSVVHAPGRCKR